MILIIFRKSKLNVCQPFSSLQLNLQHWIPKTVTSNIYSLILSRTRTLNCLLVAEASACSFLVLHYGTATKLSNNNNSAPKYNNILLNLKTKTQINLRRKIVKHSISWLQAGGVTHGMNKPWPISLVTQPSWMMMLFVNVGAAARCVFAHYPNELFWLEDVRVGRRDVPLPTKISSFSCIFGR